MPQPLLPGAGPDPLASAAEATLAAGSARVWRTRFSLPRPPDKQNFEIAEAGVADFTRRRVRLEMSEFGKGLRASAERWAQANPWLEDPDDDPDDDDTGLSLYAGSAQLHGREGNLTLVSRGDVSANRSHTDPIWIVDVLALVDDAHFRGDRETVREVACRRYGFAIALAGHEARVQIPPHLGRRPPQLAGEAWVDDANRIRRVTWTSVTVLRPRDRRRDTGGRTFWQTVELWEFGLPVRIDIPFVAPTRWLIELPRIAWVIFRRKRAYARRTRHARD